MDVDLQSLLAGQAPTPEEEMRAKADALQRRQAQQQMQAFGVLGQLSGDKVLGGLGKSLMQGAEHQGALLQQDQDRGESQLGRRLTLALQDRKDKETRDYQGKELGLRQQEVNVSGQRASADAWQPINNPTTGETIMVNRKTGEKRSLIDRPTSPAGVAFTKGAAGDGGSSKDWGDFQKAIGTGARGSLSKDIQKTLNQIEGLHSLAQLPNGSLVDMTPPQVRELGTGLAGVISKGGSQALSQIEHITPDSMASQFAAAKSFLLNEPESAQAQEFIKNMLDTLRREETTSRKQLRRSQFEGIPNFAHLRGADSKRYDSMLHNAGIDPATVDESGIDTGAAAIAAQAQGGIRVRPKGSGGPGKEVTQEQAAKFLADPRFEKVP